MSSTESSRRGFSGGPAGMFSPTDLLDRFTAGMSHEERLQHVRFLARVMDEQFVLPGTSIRFGWDSVLGLFPGLGDAITSAVSLIIVHHAWQTGASSLLIGRMLANIGIDAIVGAVPLVGDAFDFVWKANRKNARLLEQHLRASSGLPDRHRP